MEKMWTGDRCRRRLMTVNVQQEKGGDGRSVRSGGESRL